jgi:vitamin B12 transporter
MEESSTMEEVVVTANRFPQKQQQTGKVLTVIPRAVLEKSSGRNIGEILNQYAGLTVIGANNNPGTNLDVYTRGSGIGNTLILVDGSPVYDVSSISSAFDINFFTPEMIERIEILKGGQSTVYGSDAVAGVINIITKKVFKKPLQFNSTLAAGSFGSYKLGAGISGTKKDLGYSLQYQYLRTDGLSSAFDSTGKGSFDKDGLKQHNLSGGLNGKFNERLSWKLMGQMNLYKADLDANAFNDDKDNTVNNKNYMAGAGLAYQWGSAYIHANYNLNSTTRNYLDDSMSVGSFSKFSRSEYKGLSHFAELYANIKATDHWTFLVGGDARIQRTDQYFLSISSFGPYENQLSEDSANIKMYSGYASAFLHTGKGFFFEAGGRINNHSLYGTNATYTINPSFVSGNWKFFANLASAFKAPTLYQLYDAQSGNPALKPERSMSFEGGIQFSAMEQAWQSRAVYFSRKLKDGIDYSFVDFRYFNNNRATDKGLELESMFRKGKWNINFNYTYLTGEVNTVKYRYDPSSFSYIPDGDTTYNYQFRRPAHSLNLFVGYQLHKKLFLSLHGRYAGERKEPRFMKAPLEIDPYFVLDIYGEYRVNARCKFFLDLKNLLDADYIDINGFTTRPINFMGGIILTL